jgi:hypothetical protein
MTVRPYQTLFAGTEVQVLTENARRNALEEISSIGADVLLSNSVGDVITYIVEKYALSVPTIDRNAGEIDQDEGQVPAYAVPNPNFAQHVPTTQGTIYTLSIPYSGDRTMFYVRPTLYDFNAPTAGTSDTHVTITVAGYGLTSQQVNESFEKTLDSVEKYLGWLGSTVEAFNQTIPQFARPAIEARRSKLLNDRETAAGLKYPLRRRAGAPSTYSVPTVRRKIAVRSLRPTGPPSARTPILEEEHYKQILSIVENMTLVMERSPRAFSEMDEESIRIHYLVQLNGQYEGQATGETFNYRGKTDILIRYEGKNIFVAECKFWDGGKSLHSTIDQILSYTTWRDTKTAIILFSRRQEFTAVLTEATQAMKTHARYKSGPNVEGETRFRYVFTHPDDQDRDIVLTLLAFNVPRKVDGDS